MRQAAGSRRLDIRQGKIIAHEEQGNIQSAGRGIGKAVAEVQPGGVAGRAAEGAGGLQGQVIGAGFDGDFNGAELVNHETLSGLEVTFDETLEGLRVGVIKESGAVSAFLHRELQVRAIGHVQVLEGS
jgi:hypothetical protein